MPTPQTNDLHYHLANKITFWAAVNGGIGILTGIPFCLMLALILLIYALPFYILAYSKGRNNG